MKLPTYFLTILLFITVLSSCSLLNENIIEAKNLINKQHYQDAIDILTKEKESGTRNKLLSEAYLNLGVELLKDLGMAKQNRYDGAKKSFEESVKLNPKNKVAKDFYRMLIKLEQIELRTEQNLESDLQ